MVEKQGSNGHFFGGVHGEDLPLTYGGVLFLYFGRTYVLLIIHHIQYKVINDMKDLKSLWWISIGFRGLIWRFASRKLSFTWQKSPTRLRPNVWFEYKSLPDSFIRVFKS